MQDYELIVGSVDKMFWKKKPTEEQKKLEEERFEEIKKRQEPVLRELIRQDTELKAEAYPVPDKSSVDARIDEALEKLISKIKEKHFSPEIQNALKELKGPLYDDVYFTVEYSPMSDRSVHVNSDDVTLNYNMSLYGNDKYIRGALIEKVPRFPYKCGDLPRKMLIEHIYDYFFNGKLEQDIEERKEGNIKHEKTKEKINRQTADELCAKLKDLNIS
jgi:hypothetical protein